MVATYTRSRRRSARRGGVAGAVARFTPNGPGMVSGVRLVFRHTREGEVHAMHLRMGIALAAAWLAQAPGMHSRVQTREVEYRQGSTVLKGFIAWSDSVHGKRPGVLVVHEWWGLNEHARNQARRLAEAGYVGFAIDMYGNGKTTTHPQDAQAFATEATKDPAVLAARFNAAL